MAGLWAGAGQGGAAFLSVEQGGHKAIPAFWVPIDRCRKSICPRLPNNRCGNVIDGTPRLADSKAALSRSTSPFFHSGPLALAGGSFHLAGRGYGVPSARHGRRA